MGGAGGATEGGPHRQPGQMPPRAGGNGLPGIPGRAGERPAAGEQGGRHSGLAPTHHQETGEIVFRTGRLLPEVYTGFATLASPLNDLTRKALPDRIRWSEAAEKAFGTLREALCSEPVLITPDFSVPLIVHTDASEVGLGESSPRSGLERNTQ